MSVYSESTSPTNLSGLWSINSLTTVGLQYSPPLSAVNVFKSSAALPACSIYCLSSPARLNVGGLNISREKRFFQ